MRIHLFIVLLLFVSCRENATILRSGNITALKPVELREFKYDILDWKVGPRKKQEVSKGFKLNVYLPLMEEEELVRIIKKYGVDSWLVQVKKKGLLKTDTLGSFYVPFYVNKPDVGNLIINQRKDVTFKVLYTAAKFQVRFSHFVCPAFGHDLVISELDITKAKQKRKQLVMRPGKSRRYTKRIEPFNYKLIFDGGMSMIGEYYVEISFFNKKKKRILSNSINVGQKVVISEEEREVLTGCRNSDGVGKMPKRKRGTTYKDINRSR